MEILVDTNEPPKIHRLMIKHTLNSKKLITIKKVTLPVGDFVNEEKGICIERKEVCDFILSVRSKHLSKQLLQMQQFPHAYLLISGDMRDVIFNPKIKGWTVENHIGALTSCAVRYNAKILIFPNDTQLVKAVIKICEKTDDGKSIDIRDTELLRSQLTTDDMRIKLLTCFQGLGVVRAQKLLENETVYNAVSELINAVNITKH